MNEIEEAELINALQSGAAVGGAVNGMKRTVQAALLRKCCHELERQVDPRGLRLNNAVIVGCLDLAGLAVPFAFVLMDANSTQRPWWKARGPADSPVPFARGKSG